MSFQRSLRVLFSAAMTAAALSGCATTPPGPRDMPQLLASRGVAQADANQLAASLRAISFPGQLALAALSEPSAAALTRPPPAAPPASCVLNTRTRTNSDWESLIGDMKSQGVLDKALPLDEAQRQEARHLLASGEFVGDVRDMLEAVFRIDPAVADAVVHDLLQRPFQGLDSLAPLRSDAGGAAACADQYLAHVKHGNLQRPSEVCRPKVLTQTLKAVFATPGGAAVSDTARVFVRKDNRTLRLAILAYARANGINITEANLDQLEHALDRDDPDFYPLLAGAVDGLAREYGVTQLNGKLQGLRQRDDACRGRAAEPPNGTVR